MAVSLKNLSVQADALRAKLKAEQDAKEQKAAPKTEFNDTKFKPELVGLKTNYVLRILPNTYVNEGKSEPWVQTFVHIFPNPQGEKKFALCPKTLDKQAACPLCEKSRALFAKVNNKEASKAEEDIARRFYHKPRFFVNVLVVEDPRPADKGNQQGKVLVWEFGPQIRDRFTEALLDQKKTFYDVAAGYNFQLVVKKKGDYVNYESSTFLSEASPIATSDAELDRISNAIVDLQAFAIGRGCRPYEDLKALMEGRDIQKQTREYDSETGKTSTAPLNRPALDESIELNEPAAPKAAAATASGKSAAKPTPVASDEDLLKQLDDLA